MTMPRGFFPTLALLWAASLEAQPTTSDYSVSPCTLDVVLITFAFSAAGTTTPSTTRPQSPPGMQLGG